MASLGGMIRRFVKKVKAKKAGAKKTGVVTKLKSKAGSTYKDTQHKPAPTRRRKLGGMLKKASGLVGKYKQAKRGSVSTKRRNSGTAKRSGVYRKSTGRNRHGGGYK